MKKILLFMLGVLLALPGIARDFTYEYEGQTLTYTVLDEEAKTCRTKDGAYYYGSGKTVPGNKVSGELIIPAVVKDNDTEYTVTSIGFYAFAECSGLTSVSIPNTVETIEYRAFIGCTGLTSVTIPHSVTSMDVGAFSGCTGLTSVTLSESLTSISERAFSGCTGLTSVTLSESLTSIGKSAFSSTGLTSVIIPDSVKKIEAGAFSYCKSLASVTFGNTVQEIGKEAFSECKSLTSITIPNSVTTIGDKAFYFCNNMTWAIIGKSVTAMGYDTFKFCHSLIKIAYPSTIGCPENTYSVAVAYPAEDVITEDGFVYGPDKKTLYFAPYYLEGEYTIPSTVTEIGQRAFTICESLTSVKIPDSVKSIGDNAFENCTGLNSVTIGNSVNKIGKSAFYECSNLTSVIIPNSVKSIDDNAFENCTGLTSVTLGNSVTEFGMNIFKSCSSLKSLIVTNMIPATITKETFREHYASTELSVPEDVAMEYILTLWSLFDNIRIVDSEKILKTFETGNLKYRLIPAKADGENNLAVVIPGDYSSLTEVTIPERFTVTENGKNLRYYVDAVGYNAFNGCGNITTITFNSRNAARVIGEYAFAGTKISQIALPGTLKTIGNYAFNKCESLQNITIPASVTSFGKNAFSDCSSLTSATFEPGLQTIPEYAFSNCQSLQNITIPASIGTISDNAFSKCYSMSSLILESGIKNIGNFAFSECRDLKNITIPASVDSIGSFAFYKCSNLTSVTLEPGIKAIGEHAFDSCERLGNITVPGSIDTISNFAFSDCQSLCTIVVEPGVKIIGDNAFYQCREADKVTIAGSVKTIGDWAFHNINSGIRNVSLILTLNEGLESIGSNAFSIPGGRGHRQTLYIPSTVRSIGNDAFKEFNCTHIDISDLAAWFNIDFENSLANPATENSLYLNGEQIKNLVIPESVTEVKKYAFYKVPLETLTCNDALQSINMNAFFECGLTKVLISGNVRTIDECAFSWNPIQDYTFAYGAEPITINPDGFPTPAKLSWDRPIESLNFGLTKVEDLTLGNSVTEIPAARFKDLTKLSTVTLGNGLTTIGDEAFSGCTGLTEVILPPSTETIGASAFAGNTKLTSIIMGHKVKTIGEKAYDLCPAQTVSITAQTPPVAPDNTFSNYTGNLYVQGEEAAEAYYNADYCWFQFEGHVMIEPTELKVDGDKTLTGKAGDTFQLTATLYPEKVTLPQIFWRSTNPDIATVTPDGLVTLHADMSDIMAMAADDDSSENSCKIIAETLYANGPVAEITVNSISSGIDNIIDTNTPDEIDYTAPVEVYNFQGMKVATTTDNLSAGIYIIRQGNIVKKIAVK